MSIDTLQLSLRIKHLAATLLLFAVLYTVTNDYSAAVFVSFPERVNNLALALDKHIAFIPATIIPYSWSLILFMASFFMVRNSQQLLQLTSRLMMATLLACLVFYLYPARFSFIRPMSTDWTAFAYHFLQLTDKPYNQLPSLHVSYALLLGWSLWDSLRVNNKTKTIAKVVVFAYRSLLVIICSSIVVSTLLTYQHHLIDVLGGVLLAIMVLYIVDKLRGILVLKYLTVAIAGFIIIAIGGFLIRQATSLVWIEYLGLALATYWLGSFMVLAWLYQLNNIVVNKNWFKKSSEGKLTLLTWLSFVPLLLAYKMMSSLGQLYSSYKQNRKSSDKTDSKIASEINGYNINENLLTLATARLSSVRFISQQATQPDQLIIIDVAAEISSHFYSASSNLYQQNIHYLYLPLLDLQPFQDTDAEILLYLFKQIDSLSNLNNDDLAPTIWLNFHCVMGFSRSIAVQILYLLYCDKLSMDNYQQWIAQYYPNAHVEAYYLPKSLLTTMVNTQHLTPKS